MTSHAESLKGSVEVPTSEFQGYAEELRIKDSVKDETGRRPGG